MNDIYKFVHFHCADRHCISGSYLKMSGSGMLIKKVRHIKDTHTNNTCSRTIRSLFWLPI